MLNESRRRGSSAASAERTSSAAIASSICACCSAETCCSAVVVAAASERGWGGGVTGADGCCASVELGSEANSAIVNVHHSFIGPAAEGSRWCASPHEPEIKVSEDPA